MAAILSLDTLSGLSGIFIFLFVWVLIFGVLSVVKPFGEKKEGLYAMIALAMGLLVGMNQTAINVFTFFTSWFSIVIILVFFLLLAVMMFGFKMEDMSTYIKEGSSGRQIIIWIIIFAIVIMAIGLATNLGPSLLATRTGGEDTQPIDLTGSQGSVEVVDQQTGVSTYYDYDYRTDRGLDSRGTVTTTTTSSSGTGGNDFQQNFVNTLFHPNVLGLALFMLIGMFATLWISDPSEPGGR